MLDTLQSCRTPAKYQLYGPRQTV